MSTSRKRNVIPFTGKMDLVVRPGSKYARAEDWERHRETITRLYQGERKSLKELMAIMERDYGHVGTSALSPTRLHHFESKTT
jgi:hypothetical protein